MYTQADVFDKKILPIGSIVTLTQNGNTIPVVVLKYSDSGTSMTAGIIPPHDPGLIGIEVKDGLENLFLGLAAAPQTIYCVKITPKAARHHNLRRIWKAENE